MEKQKCWICFEDRSETVGWIKACKCSLECHESCLMEWIIESQKGHFTKQVHCPQCQFKYVISNSERSLIDAVTFVDDLINNLVPLMSIVALSGFTVISLASYGAFAVVSVHEKVSYNDIWRLINKPTGILTMLKLSLIPLALISSKVPFADPVVSMLTVIMQKRSRIYSQNSIFRDETLVISYLPVLRKLYNTFYGIMFSDLEKRLDIMLRNCPVNSDTIFGIDISFGFINEDDFLDEPVEERPVAARSLRSEIRLFLEPLFMPSISFLSGRSSKNLIFRVLGMIPFFRIHCSPFNRNIIGGCLFVLFKDMFTLLYKYKLVQKYRNRKILDFK